MGRFCVGEVKIKWMKKKIRNQPLTACKQYCLAAGATQGNIAYKQNVKGKLKTKLLNA
jgi:hypothetical protein